MGQVFPSYVFIVGETDVVGWLADWLVVFHSIHFIHKVSYIGCGCVGVCIRFFLLSLLDDNGIKWNNTCSCTLFFYHMVAVYL